jgi:pyridinium-3,5-biscarboxylic acid mononucleotide sulfurtransferase
MVLCAPSGGLRLEELRNHIKSLESVLVCFSGGIDSALLLAVATEQLRDRAMGLTAVSASLPEAERLEAERLARGLDAKVVFVESRELEDPMYARNAEDRCFHCKSELYEIAEQKRVELGLKFIVNGTNRDDMGDYRPGLAAAQNAQVRSPLLELGLTKSDVRAAAHALGLDVWDKPASACLASRIPYGTSVTRERLAQIDRFETKLKAMGFRQVRVRWHDQIARIEVALGELELALHNNHRESMVAAGKECGFHFITLDLAGYRTGSHNELLHGKNLKLV